MQFSLILALVLVYTGAPSLGCAPCKCYLSEDEDERYDWQAYDVALCDKPYTFTAVPNTAILPAKIQDLRVKKQSIPTLKENQFIDFPDLQIIILSSNQISKVENHAFRNMTNVISISLYRNLITTLPTQLFSDTPNLKYVSLTENKLTVLQSNLFSNLMKLEQVWVRYNYLTSVEENCFINVPLLKMLLVTKNELRSLNLNIMDNPSTLKELYQGVNPWHCDESLCEIMGAWVYGKLYRGSFSYPYCASPQNLKGKSWNNAVSACNLPLQADEHSCGPCRCRTSPPAAICSTPFRLDNIPMLVEYVPQDITYLNFTGQRMPTIHQNEFSSFKSIQKLYLDRNHVNQIELKAFNSLRNLTTLSLNNNRLTVLTTFQFANLIHLKEIYLSRNEISHIKENSFFNLPAIDTVDLSFNRLQSLQLNIFNNKNGLKSLWLHNNPWNCDETLCEIMNEVVTRELWGENEVPTCAAPSKVVDWQWNQIGETFQPKIISSVTSLIEGENLILQCKFCFTSQTAWSLNGKKLSEYNQEISTQSLINKLTVTNIHKEHQGNYKCEVTNCDNCKHADIIVGVRPNRGCNFVGLFLNASHLMEDNYNIPPQDLEGN